MFRSLLRTIPGRAHFSSASTPPSWTKHASYLSLFPLSPFTSPSWAAHSRALQSSSLSVANGRRSFHGESASRMKWIPFAVGGASLLALQLSYVRAEEKDHQTSNSRKEDSASNVNGHEVQDQVQETKEKDDEIPKYDYVIIGGGMSCVSALEAIRKNDKTGSILVINKEDHFPYERSPLSKGLWYKGRKNVPADVADKLGDLYNFAGVDSRKVEENFSCTFLQNESVERAWGDDRVIALGSRKLIRYGKLLVAMGSIPDVPFDVTDNALPHVSTFQTIEDFEDLKALADHGGKTITIIGGGLTGCELASILSFRTSEEGREGNRIIHLVREGSLLEKYIPKYLGDFVAPQLQQSGVELRTNQNVKLIRKGADDSSGFTSRVNVGAEVSVKGKVQVVLESGEEIDSDYVIIAAGSTPNMDLADDLKLELDYRNGGIAVNSQLEAVAGVYVAGDLASYYDRTLKVRRRNERGDNAIYQGQLAGHNMSLQPPDMSGAASQEVIERRISKASPMHFAYQPIYSSVVGGNWFHAVGVIDPKRYKVFGVFDAKDGAGEKKEYKRGVIYYLRPEVDAETGQTSHQVMGILLWNVSRIRLAQRTLKGNAKVINKDELIRLIPLEEPKEILPFNPKELDVGKEEKESEGKKE